MKISANDPFNTPAGGHSFEGRKSVAVSRSQGNCSAVAGHIVNLSSPHFYILAFLAPPGTL